MFYDRSCRLNVFVAAPRGGVSAQRADVAGTLRRHGVASRSAGPVVVRDGKYDYLQLQAWYGRLPQLLGMEGVVFTDIDETQNRLRIGIAPGTSPRQIANVVGRLGVPREAVIISRASPVRRVATLRDRVRPLAGGLQIFFPSPSRGRNVAFICTMGFNARVSGVRGANFFVTNSHCSDVQGGKERTLYSQPVPSREVNNFIGVEYRDPAYGNPGGQCFEGFRCRYSDASLVRYAPEISPSLGSIYRTTYSLSRLGSVEIDSRASRWRIVGEQPFALAGQTLEKVGRSSGWTTGPVILTCADFGVAETDLAQLCQDVVLSGVRPGDSGAPVFARLGPTSSDVLLTGILWGGGDLDGLPVYVFSSMENIEFDLGPLITSSPSAVASR